MEHLSSPEAVSCRLRLLKLLILLSPAKNRGNQCLLPLTMKQISDAYQTTTNPISSLDSVDVNHVTLLGLVLNKVEKVTDVNFSLDDGTGQIDVHRWVNDEGELNEMAGIMNGMYVRVHGQLKGFQGKKHAVAFSVRPVTDFNEIAYHFIQLPGKVGYMWMKLSSSWVSRGTRSWHQSITMPTMATSIQLSMTVISSQHSMADMLMKRPHYKTRNQCSLDDFLFYLVKTVFISSSEAFLLEEYKSSNAFIPPAQLA